MAFGKCSESKEAVEFKNYIGVGAFKIVAVNPTKEEMEKLGYNPTQEPVYTGEDEQTHEKWARVDLYMETIPEKNNGISMKIRPSFFLRNTYNMNKDNTKIQVINEYGETAWVYIEEAKSQIIPESFKQWYVGPYKPCISGEEALTTFAKVFLGIPNRSFTDKNGVRHDIPVIKDAACTFDNLKEIFKGNFKEIKNLLGKLPNNYVKLAVGVKTTDDNKKYPDVYTRMIVRSNVTKYDRLQKSIEDSQKNGAYSSTVFSTSDLHEYVEEEVKPTSFADNSGLGIEDDNKLPWD